MIPAPFTYRRAESTAHAVALLSEHGDDAKLLAGGQSLLPVLKLRLARPEVLVDISRLAELSYARVEGDELAIGAGTRHRELVRSDVVRAETPLLAAAAGHVGDPQIRS
ncbi:MAG: FAD binding domain-containing protein, partial [Actinomycetota bacterium]|nr:FAD binding domain-containing protein [Actinomycetota bacterium]